MGVVLETHSFTVLSFLETQEFGFSGAGASSGSGVEKIF